MKRKVASLAVVVILGVTSAGCPKNKPNIQTNPVGAVAAYGLDVTNAVRAVQSTVILAEQSKLIPTDAARKVVLVTREMGVKAQELAAALTELDKLNVGDLSRAALLTKVGFILKAMNQLIVQTLVPIDNADLRTQLSTILNDVGELLLKLSAALGPGVTIGG
jgi:hypothetical protein